ncbi:unnamed protein product, partial [Polarella glacialis]
FSPASLPAVMQLRYYLDSGKGGGKGKGKRVYTMEGTITQGEEDERPTFSAHPARFSPDDKYSDQRIKCKKRFGMLKTQEKAVEL